ncbi:hypothetical protein [Actinomadura sp. KC06]|uniref:hypothetical protein n=1 Tax=Actinomadura sp. KC06 TaxID=2530369 RepID=UPI00140553EA|nr:hypothetical protein [Actinomadura sp. KC06]
MKSTTRSATTMPGTATSGKASRQFSAVASPIMMLGASALPMIWHNDQPAAP